jgi:hypothetical protein
MGDLVDDLAVTQADGTSAREIRIIVSCKQNHSSEVMAHHNGFSDRF